MKSQDEIKKRIQRLADELDKIAQLFQGAPCIWLSGMSRPRDISREVDLLRWVLDSH